MNNSNIVSDIETKPSLESQKGEWTQIAEALKGVEASEDWQKLKRLLFDGVLSSLENLLQQEATKREINTPEIYRLQGQLVWARKYADLGKLSDSYRKQIENINNQINGKNPRDGAL